MEMLIIELSMMLKFCIIMHNDERLLKGILSDELDKDTSFCILKEGKVVSYVAVETVDKNTLKIPMLYSGTSDPRETMSMLGFSVAAIKDNYRADTKIAMLAFSPASEKIIEYCFDFVTPISRSYIKFI